MFDRLRSALHVSWFQFRTRAVHGSPPTPCDPEAPCTVHTMLSARDLHLYLVAVQSLLRFRPAMAIAVHSDGTLTASHEQTLKRHVPGLRFIAAEEANEHARKVLGADSFLFRWRDVDAAYRRVIDTELWCSTPRRIIMDADVLVLRRPDEVIDWAANGSKGFLLGQPPAGEPPGSPSGRKHVQTVFREKLPQIAKRLSLPDTFPQGTTGGFYGCTGKELALERIETAIEAAEAEGVPMNEWGGDQAMLIYLLAAAGATRLGPRRYINFDPTCVPFLDEVCVSHFYGTFRYYRHLYTRLAAGVVAGLLASP
jgi:hypothetical protein